MRPETAEVGLALVGDDAPRAAWCSSSWSCSATRRLRPGFTPFASRGGRLLRRLHDRAASLRQAARVTFSPDGRGSLEGGRRRVEALEFQKIAGAAARARRSIRSSDVRTPRAAADCGVSRTTCSSSSSRAIVTAHGVRASRRVRGLARAQGQALERSSRPGVEFVRNMCVDVIGEKDGPRYFPFLATMFFFILFNNVLGLIPGCKPGTGTIGVTVALRSHGLHLRAVGFQERRRAATSRAIPSGVREMDIFAAIILSGFISRSSRRSHPAHHAGRSSLRQHVRRPHHPRHLRRVRASSALSSGD